MMRKRLIGAAFGAVLLSGAPAQAATLFLEDFSDEAATFGATLNFTNFDQFGVSGGTVDLITGGSFGIACATVGCVDLDGSTGNAGFLSAPLTFLGGVEYTILAWLSGNQRNLATETVEFGISPSVFRNVVLGPDTPVFSEFALTFTLAADTTTSLFFADLGNDNIGAILDRVIVTFDDTGLPPIPLPASALLLLGGMAGLGALRAAKRARG